MIQEDKELLLKDLCARLPYGVKVSVDNTQWCDFCKDIPYEITLENSYRILSGVRLGFVKPYLFLLSSMTKEQKEFIKNKFCYDWDIDDHPHSWWVQSMEIGNVDELIDWFHKNHFDYRGLIPKGLALDATGKNIY